MNEKKSWKETLNLPTTEFPMKANLPNREPERLEAWSKSDLYTSILEARRDRERFDLHDGPPYANGEIHIGHAMNKILKDFVVKSRSMMGYRAAYIPGWDCHGLPIEHKVDKKLGKKKRDMTPREFRLACREFADENLDIQRDDFIRLGVLGAWDEPYKTMNYDYEADIAKTLGEFFEKELVYKGLKPVHWCTRCQTALAEAEVEYDDKTSPSIYVAFEADSEVAEKLGLDTDKPLRAVIWTTTPWTIPANLAIALHPDLEYSVLDTGDQLHMVATELKEKVSEVFGWDEATELLKFRGGQIERLTYRHPLYDRAGLFVLGDYVTLEAGTGLVHTAPGHGADDFNTGRTYELEVLTPVDHRGVFTSQAQPWEGEHVYKANPQIIDTLREKGALLHDEEFHHSYPHCWRCKTPVIFRATEQWFITMDEGGLRQTALDQIEKVEWHPRWGYERIKGMVTDRPDWCISRQRLWGVPITVLYCTDCNEHVATPELFEKVVAAFRTDGADAWFEREPSEFLPEGYACSCGSSDFRKETDILDVWFDSGASHIAVSEGHGDMPLPVDLYVEGHDQHRGWFQSSLLIGCGTRGESPYRSVITHGFVVDENGRKMSKSLGNVVSPQEVIRQHGADVLRLWVSMVDYRGDIGLGPEIIKRISESYRKIRNTARFLIANLYDFDPTTDMVPNDELEPLDRWILHRAGAAFDRCRKAYDDYEFHTVYHRLVELCTVDLSAIYSDVVKDRLYVEGPDSRTRRAAQTAIYRIADELARIVAPILAFTADEIWESLPGNRDESVHLSEFSDTSAWRLDQKSVDDWNKLLELRETVTGVLEKARARKEIGQSLAADIHLGGTGIEELAHRVGTDLSKLFIVSHVDFSDADGAEAFEVQGLGKVQVGMKNARGNKCGRCWHFREDVADDELCSRCSEVVESLGIAAN